MYNNANFISKEGKILIHKTKKRYNKRWCLPILLYSLLFISLLVYILPLSQLFSKYNKTIYINNNNFQEAKLNPLTNNKNNINKNIVRDMGNPNENQYKNYFYMFRFNRLKCMRKFKDNYNKTYNNIIINKIEEIKNITAIPQTQTLIINPHNWIYLIILKIFNSFILSIPIFMKYIFNKTYIQIINSFTLINFTLFLFMSTFIISKVSQYLHPFKIYITEIIITNIHNQLLVNFVSFIILSEILIFQLLWIKCLCQL